MKSPIIRLEQLEAKKQTELHKKFSNNLIEGEVSLIGGSINNTKLKKYFAKPDSNQMIKYSQMIENIFHN